MASKRAPYHAGDHHVAVRVQSVRKQYRKAAHAHRFLTLKSALLGGDLFKVLAPADVFTALDEVSLEIARGETLGVIGSNGAGKSTLLKIIAGTTKPTAGAVFVDGKVSALIELGAGFHPEISGRENVFINGIMLGLSRQQVTERFDDIVAFAELEDFIDAPVKTYSSGMYMRLGFSIAIHIDPEVLLIDEVLAVGDEAFVHKCLDKLAAFKRRGKTILLVSHSLESVRRLCDRVVWLKNGKVEASGDPPRVIDAYLNWVAHKEEGELAAGSERRTAEVSTGKPGDAPGAPRDAADVANIAKGGGDTAATGTDDADPATGTAGAAPYETGRWGSHQVVIDKVRLLDGAGEQHYVFTCGDPVTLELTLLATEAVDDFAIGIGIFNADGVCCYGTNTDIERFEAGRLEGSATVRVEIPELNLIEGTYYLDLAVHRIDGYPYDYQRGLTRFRTTSPIADTGVARLPHSWSFEGGISWKKTPDADAEANAGHDADPRRRLTLRLFMLRAVAEIIAEHADFRGVVRSLEGRQTVLLEGPTGAYRAALLARLQEELARPLAVVLPKGVDREAMLLDLRAFHPAGEGHGHVVAFPPLAVDPYGTLTPHPDHIRERIQTLDRCAGGRVDIVLAPVLSWLERLQPMDRFVRSTLVIKVGDELPPEELLAALLAAGYRRDSLVESLGELAVRGGVVDVFPPTREHPVRLEYFGDHIESIREFNPRDQRSMRSIDAIELPPAREHFDLAASIAGEIADPVAGPPRAVSEGTPVGGSATLADYLNDPLWVEIEPESFAPEESDWSEYLDEHYHRALAEGRDAPLPEDLYGELNEALRRPSAPHGRLLMRELATEEAASGAVRLLGPPAPAFQGRMADLADAVGKAVAAGERVCLAMSRPGSAQRLAEVLEEYEIPVALSLPPKTDDHPTLSDASELPPGTCCVICADLSAGFRLPDQALWLGSDAEVFGRTRVRGRRRRFHGDAFRADFRNLAPGDAVVHVEHGIGEFIAVRTLDVEGEAREFMEIHYRGEDRLYLPMEQLYLVQRYRGVEGAAPKLDKLGGTSWGNVKNRVKKELREMASELLELYAARKTIKGHAYGEDTPWQREMEDAFEFEETPDQLTAIAEIKADMELAKPMDRLLCGDVGYGKTEVAMRAAFKAVMDGKQVAVLAPTTVLAQQHLLTFAERLAAFPLRVDVMSRFRSDSEQKEVLRGLADGSVDILVGTHRILSRDVLFKNLGLLIVDEEQRFGVQHKERIKQLKRHLDVLSMTATPIPRTLQMSLIGVRDLSVIESPPRDRFAVATHVMVYDPEVIASAIRAELSRDGQIFFVHNRVETIYSMVETLRALVPEARFCVGHGQLPERELERVMLAFVRHEADVLVSTTIIENGLDIPLANTMIINRADTFGLAQLYQLRGRVGRSDRRASAYLMIPPPDTLSDVARKRLRAIQEFADLGSGFRLAALDLEIRGAGSLLGERQHGHMAAVGFEMYARLLEEAVHELEGQPAPAEVRAQLNLGVGFSIPVAYVEDPLQRLMVAKRLASVRDQAQLEALRDEVRDRYGAMPREVEDLFDYAQLRLEAETLGILSADRVGRNFELRIGRDAGLDLAALLVRVEQEPGWSIRPPDRLVVRAPAGDSDERAADSAEFSPVMALRAVLESLPQTVADPH